MTEPTTLFADRALLPAGWARDVAIAIDAKGRITATATGQATSSASIANGTSVTLTRRALLPAPANLHSHAHQRAMAGLGERRGTGSDSFWSWRKIMYSLLDRYTPEHLEAIVALVFKEMLEAGFASVGEFHYLHNDQNGYAYSQAHEMCERLVAAADQTGIGLTLLPVLYTQGGVDRRPPEAQQRRFQNDLSSFTHLMQGANKSLGELQGDAILGLALHSLRAVDPESLGAVVDAFGDGPIHIHAAEQTAEVKEVAAALGAPPVAWLLENAPLDHRWCIIHATHMTATERAALARSGAVAGLCPITEANLGDGIFDGVQYRAEGGRFGFGSDSNVHISLTEELRLYEYGQRLRDQGRCLLADDVQPTGEALFSAAVHGGAQALGRGEGGIAPGQWADLVAIDLDGLAFSGCDFEQLLDAWIFASHGTGLVTDVWSAGRHVVRDGHHLQASAIEKRYMQTMAELRGAVRANP